MTTKYLALVLPLMAAAACSESAAPSAAPSVDSPQPSAAAADAAAPTAEARTQPTAAAPQAQSTSPELPKPTRDAGFSDDTDAGSLVADPGVDPAISDAGWLPDASAIQDAASAPVSEPSGSCAGAMDQALFAEAGFDPEETAPSCVLPQALAGGGPGTASFVPNVSECLARDTKISVECATCYAINAECSFAGCSVICLSDRNSAECRDCRCGRTGQANCIAQRDTCTGLVTTYCD